MKDKRVLAFMISRADTPARCDALKATIEEALETAGYPFYLYLHLYTKEAMEAIKDIKFTKGEANCRYYVENMGQHIPTNDMISHAKSDNYRYLLRLDDDCKFITRNWLRKMVEAAEVLGDDFILSPTVKGLINQVPKSDKTTVKGVDVRFTDYALGGVCRLHPVATITKEDDPYVSDVRQPMGFGDATGLGKWCRRNRVWMAYLERVTVKHSTAKQREEDPTYHKWQEVFQHIPYIPANVGKEA